MTYRQIARKLRLNRIGPDDLVSERPYNEDSGVFEDLDANGNSTTMIEYPDDVVDRDIFIAKHLKLGAIEEMGSAASAKKAEPVAEVVEEEEEEDSDG